MTYGTDVCLSLGLKCGTSLHDSDAVAEYIGVHDLAFIADHR